MNPNGISWIPAEIKQLLPLYHQYRIQGMAQTAAFLAMQSVLPDDRRRLRVGSKAFEFEKRWYKPALERKELVTIPGLPGAPEMPDSITLEESSTHTRLVWDEEEIELLAMGWCEARLKNPFEANLPLFETVQQQLLKPERQRTINSLRSVPKLYARIIEVWKEQTLKAEPPPPSIIHVMEPQPINFVDVCARLDTPSLVAMLVDRLGGILKGVKVQIPDIAPATNGHAPISIIAAASPPVVPRNPQVALLGVDWPTMAKVRDDVKHHNIAVDVRLVDCASREQHIPVACEFVVIMERIMGSKASKAAKESWPTSKIFVVKENVDAIVQQMRNLASMKRPSTALK